MRPWHGSTVEVRGAEDFAAEFQRRSRVLWLVAYSVVRNSADPAALIAAVRFETTSSAAQPDDPEEILSDKFGRMVLLPHSPTVRYLGLRTDAGVPPVVVVLLVTDGDRRLVLTFEPAGTLPPIQPSSIGSVTRRERTTGGLRITEWTNGDAATIIDAISVQ